MPPYNIPKGDSVKLQTIGMDDDGLRGNLSQQQLVNSIGPDGVIVTTVGDSPSSSTRQISKRQIICVAVLCYVNLINYMDRFTVAGILYDLQRAFNMNESQSGLLQTAFILVYMIMAPIFGYLGDRFTRKYLMAVGVFVWSLTTLLGSFVPNYGLFLLCRCLVGVGEASYSTIAPTIISDLFVKDMRSRMLAIFYFAIPVGSGMGYIIGAEVTELAKNIMGDPDSTEAWRWGLRVTPVMGLIAVILILVLLQEPPRGESEGGEHLQATSFASDLRYLFTNPSFILSTLAFTCVAFVAGALSWWGPLFVQLGIEVQEHPSANEDNVSFIFGVIAMVAGIVGVPLGSFAGQVFRRRNPAADPLVCGLGLLFSCPLIVAAIFLAGTNTSDAYAVVFFGQVFLNLNWAVVSDIVLYVVIPTRRSSAEAFQILFSHAFGDAGSPYLIGVVAEALKPFFASNETIVTTTTLPVLNETTTFLPVTTTEPPEDLYAKFKSLQYAMIMCAVVEVLGAIFFFWNACYIAKDKERCDRIVAGELLDGRPGIGGVPQLVHRYADEAEAEQAAHLIT